MTQIKDLSKKELVDATRNYQELHKAHFVCWGCQKGEEDLKQTKGAESLFYCCDDCSQNSKRVKISSNQASNARLNEIAELLFCVEAERGRVHKGWGEGSLSALAESETLLRNQAIPIITELMQSINSLTNENQQLSLQVSSQERILKDKEDEVKSLNKSLETQATTRFEIEWPLVKEINALKKEKELLKEALLRKDN